MTKNKGQDSRFETISRPLANGFGEWMSDKQQDLCWILIEGGGIDPEKLEAETRRIMDADPRIDGLVAVMEAAKTILGKPPEKGERNG